MRRMPTTIRVGYQDYIVEAWSAASAAAARRIGECDNGACIIRISDTLDARVMANTLLHEVIHACWYIAGIEAGDDEERVVNCLTNQLAQVWRDNPALVAFITAKLV